MFFTKGFLLRVFTKGFYYEILIMTSSKFVKWVILIMTSRPKNYLNFVY